ncbi:MAG TPA: LCP family protein [bacterium]|nr:LCP family protein [bacterium]
MYKPLDPRPSDDPLAEMLNSPDINPEAHFEPLEPANNLAEPIKITVESKRERRSPEEQTDGRLPLRRPPIIEKPRLPKKHSGVFFLIIGLILLGYLSWRVLSVTPSELTTNNGNKQEFSFWKSLSLLTKFKLGVNERVPLKGENEDRINFVLLGMGGPNHDGANLTDTIIVGSFKPSTKRLVLMNIPRDLSVPIAGYGWRKINSANALAEAKEPGSGGQATADLIGEILEIPIHYYFRVDFAGFVKIIDDLGGIEVEVDNTLDDYSYPIMGEEENPDYYSRFEHLHIDAGRQTMDGELALKYARSRHGVGAEGSDFARSKRQQKILMAIKEKLFDANNLFRPKLIMNIISDAENHVSTNLTPEELVSAWQLAKDIKAENIININLDNSPTGLLYDQKGADGAYFLVPRAGDFREIIAQFNAALLESPTEENIVSPTTDSHIDESSEIVAPSPTINPADLPTKANAKLDIRNSTAINGLAARTRTKLQKYGFTVVNVSNTSHKNLPTTTIYDLTYGAKPEDLALLQYQTKAVAVQNIPDWLAAETSELLKNKQDMTQPDFILILGNNYSEQ